MYEELGVGKSEVKIASSEPLPHILPRIPFGKHAGRRFEDINSGYLNWVIHNINDEHVLATARYHLNLRAAGGSLG